ncbi:short-chain dehydrogenase/reductase SDR [Vibrio ishigakensis]|uniref:Short-chain dehydrogenase/reductase SDR n=1 Tax=Vibrio ishigakensis TaxID=1481914 RepID=A0A0B8NH32_9VIBR|nr:SDR family oxidoreductase [Vibrio ishigakensis]GAM54080.1 short-chain dehydrogenase/reductase SDR [Vibrio ishigakensis]
MNILVTGATSGIGFELAKLLSKQGHKVVATGRNRDKLQQLENEHQCLVIAADLANTNELDDMFELAVHQLGHLDVLINNAGLNTRKAMIDEFSLEEFDFQYAVNLRAPALLCQKALKVMKPNESGTIINVVSTVAKRANESMSVYTAMKQGFAGFSSILMKEAQPHGIKVSTLFPGGTDTNFREQSRPQYMSPESVAKTIAAILSLPDDVVMHEMLFRPPVEIE